MCTQLQVVLHHLGVTSTLFWCKLTRIPRLHNTVLVFFYPIQIRIVSGLHYCGVNVHHVGVTFTLNWCSHSCKNLHFFGVTITLALFLCVNENTYFIKHHSMRLMFHVKEHNSDFLFLFLIKSQSFFLVSAKSN